jgi:short-subunit dehydrogenase
MLCRLFAEKTIRENRKGFILNIASIASWMMMPGIALYSSSKSFVRGFSRAMRHEVFDRGISITTVCPGAVATGLYNLPPRYMKLGIRLGIIIPPERLARLALKKMFRRKAEFIPGGFINRLLVFLVNAMPEALVRRIKKLVQKT